MSNAGRGVLDSRILASSTALALGLGASIHSEAADPIAFELISSASNRASIQLTNGVKPTLSDWPALVVSTILTSDGKAVTCSGALVGPKVLLTAAHCVDSGVGAEARRVTLRIADRLLPGNCEMHPDYSSRPFVGNGLPRGSEDFALCLLNDEGVQVNALAALRFEVVEASKVLEKGDAVLMTGFGCSDLRVINGKFSWTRADGNLRIGDETVNSPPDANAPSAGIRSVRTKEPALCPGDSGGPLFSGASAKSPADRRRIRGVNSMICTNKYAISLCSSDVGDEDAVSIVAVTGSQVFLKWVNCWMQRNRTAGGDLCGLSLSAGVKPCRD